MTFQQPLNDTRYCLVNWPAMKDENSAENDCFTELIARLNECFCKLKCNDWHTRITPVP